MSDIPCVHPQFILESAINKIDDEDGTPIRYHVDIKIHCEKCGEPFVFLGLPGGLDYSKPTVSFGREELRVPIEPRNQYKENLT